MKLRVPLISLNNTIPQKEARRPGPLVIIGNATAKPSAPFATNHAVWATPLVSTNHHNEMTFNHKVSGDMAEMHIHIYE